MKILFVTPHLSTGGLPQYLLKQVESFSKKHEVFVIEYSDIAPIYVVQKNKIRDIIKDNLITLGETKQDILKYISQINPEVIHFQEIPEDFIDTSILDKIYRENRIYNIIVTTHSSYTDPSRINYTADKFVLVSNWSKNIFERYYKGEIPCDVWEYPIEKIEYNKEEAKKHLGWDPEYKHILHVGLFTSGKNQKHIIEVARLCLDYKIKFHFIGNQAGNFEDYWKPLMKNLPKNCIWHGERNDVENFYKAADLFYFPSLYELSPISIKEALSYNLPLFLTKLHTYGNDYDNVATYINTSDIKQAKQLLLSHFNIESIQAKDEIPILHILTDFDTEREVKSMQSLTKLSNYGMPYKIIISKRYTDLPPAETCQYPDKISMEPGGKLTPGHYGCYLGHRKAFETGLDLDKDYMFIFECDCVIDVPYSVFLEKVKFACEKLKTDNLLMFSFGFHNNSHILEKKEDYWIVDRFYGAHAYLIPRKSYDIIKNMYETCKWNVADLLFVENLNQYRIGIFETPITKQTAGYSILDKIHNDDRY